MLNVPMEMGMWTTAKPVHWARVGVPLPVEAGDGEHEDALQAAIEESDASADPPGLLCLAHPIACWYLTRIQEMMVVISMISMRGSWIMHM